MTTHQIWVLWGLKLIACAAGSAGVTWLVDRWNASSRRAVGRPHRDPEDLPIAIIFWVVLTALLWSWWS